MQWLGRLLVCTRMCVTSSSTLHVTHSLRCHVQLVPLDVPAGMQLGLCAHVKFSPRICATLAAGWS